MLETATAIVESIVNLFNGEYDGVLSWIGIDEDHWLVGLIVG